MWNEYFLASKNIPQRLTETDFTLVECFEPSQDPCGLRGRCQWQSVLRQALEAYFRVLDGVTMADLVAQQKAAEGVPLRWRTWPAIPGCGWGSQDFKAGGASGSRRGTFEPVGWISPISWLNLSPLILVL